MFQIFGTAVSRGWPILLAGWVLLVGWTTLAAPSWDDIAESGQFSFLPGDVPSNRGMEYLKRAFPQQPPANNLVLNLSREDGPGLGEDDRDFIVQVLKPELGRNPELNTRIHALDNKGEGALLKSADNKATLVVVELPGSLIETKQLGLALAFGVLVDTLIVRPVLVPAFLIWMRR